MSSSKVRKNLAEEDRREKALKKERKSVKKWKWTTAHSEQSFRKEEQLGLSKGIDLAPTSAHEDEGFLYFRVEDRVQLTSMTLASHLCTFLRGRSCWTAGRHVAGDQTKSCLVTKESIFFLKCRKMLQSYSSFTGRLLLTTKVRFLKAYSRTPSSPPAPLMRSLLLTRRVGSKAEKWQRRLILRRTVMLTVSEVMRTARRRRRKTRGRMLKSKAAMIQQIFPVIANAVQGGFKVAMPSAKWMTSLPTKWAITS